MDQAQVKGRPLRLLITPGQNPDATGAARCKTLDAESLFFLLNERGRLFNSKGVRSMLGG